MTFPTRSQTTILNARRQIGIDLPRAFEFLGNLQRIEVEEVWTPNSDRHWMGEVMVSIIGKPVTYHAVQSLTKTARGCQYFIRHALCAKVLLIASKLEQYLLALAEDGSLRDCEHLQETLSS